MPKLSSRALDDLIGSIGAEQPSPVDRDLIANTEAVLRFRGADAGDRIAEGLHRGHLEDELLIQIEEVLQAYARRRRRWSRCR